MRADHEEVGKIDATRLKSAITRAAYVVGTPRGLAVPDRSGLVFGQGLGVKAYGVWFHSRRALIADELYSPTKGWAGVTVRSFDLAKRQWSIYWISSKTGLLGAPQIGGFAGDHGEFYGDDEDDGRPTQVRYAWTKLDHDHARWEQAFSYDGDGRSWETNWTADFTAPTRWRSATAAHRSAESGRS
jgi:hypothetical protein